MNTKLGALRSSKNSTVSQAVAAVSEFKANGYNDLIYGSNLGDSGDEGDGATMQM